MITVHVNVTHPDGEGDITDLVLPEDTETDKVRDLAVAEHGHLFVPGDVVDLTIEGHFAPFDSFTWKDEEKSIHVDLSDAESFPCGGCGINLYTTVPDDGILTCPICGHKESV